MYSNYCVQVTGQELIFKLCSKINPPQGIGFYTVRSYTIFDKAVISRNSLEPTTNPAEFSGSSTSRPCQENKCNRIETTVLIFESAV